MFFGSAHRRLPGRRFRLKRWSKRLAKLPAHRTRPAPIYAENHANAAYPAEKDERHLFRRDHRGKQFRARGVPALLDKLRAAGFTVDAPDRHHLPADEFMKRCAQAWIAHGAGWDCYRHMEAAVAGSVPLVSAPTIDRYRPLVIGEQCLSYHPDEDRIVAIVGAALADKERLRAMALSARQHVLKHLTVRAISVDLLARHCGETGAEASTGG